MGLLARIRRNRLPAEAKRRFEPSEHVVAWAPVAGRPSGDGSASTAVGDGSAGGTVGDGSAGSTVGGGSAAGAAGDGLAGGAVGNGYLVATNRGLWLPGREERLGWHEIHKATWSGRELVLTPARLVRSAGEAPDAPADVFADDEPLTFRIDDPAELPYQIRVRVTKSVAFSAHHELPNGGVRVVARRVPGVDGLHWALRYDAGTAMIGPDHDLVADYLAQARNTAETA